MTTHDDLETRLRASLRERAGDVETTPHLYEEVQRRASRGAWLRRGFALAGAAAAVVLAFTVVPTLLPDQPLQPDVLPSPEDVLPTEDATEAPTEGAAPGVTDALLQARVAFADDSGTVTVEGRIVTSPAPVVSLAVSPFWTSADGAVAAGLEDGRIGIVDQRADGGDAFDALVDAEANGSVAFSPDGTAIAWIEGTDLHILPLASELDGERVAPLEGDVPPDLVIEQWFYGSDAQLIYASDPAGGIWRIPMDDSNATNSAPTEPATLLPAAADREALDAALLSDLSTAVLRVTAEGSTTLTVGDVVIPVDAVSAVTTELVVTGGAMTVFDPTTGVGSRREVGVDSIDLVAEWTTPGITAVAPLPAPIGGEGDDTAATDASALGLPTGSPVIGTAGTDLVLRFSDGEVRNLTLFPQPETEATLGRLAAMPGSTTEYGLVAVESSSEGQNSIRFAGLRDGGVEPVGDVIVVNGPVTGMVWSEDGRHLAWSDAAGLHVATVDDAGEVAGDTAGTLLTDDARPLLDWVWTEGTQGATSGYLTVAVAGGTGVELVGIARAADDTLRLDPAVGGGSDRLMLSTHGNPGAAASPEVTAQVGGGTAVLTWSADGDQSGELADPGLVNGDVRVVVSGGHVLVLGMERQVLVTFDGNVVDLPTAADWDVLD